MGFASFLKRPDGTSYFMVYIAEDAEALAVGNGYNTQSAVDSLVRNAFAHTYTSADLMYNRYIGLGYEWPVQSIGTFKEDYTSDTVLIDSGDEYKDQYNNALGRNISLWLEDWVSDQQSLGNVYTDIQIKAFLDDLVVDAYNSGDMIWDSRQDPATGDFYDARIEKDITVQEVINSVTWSAPTSNWQGSSLGKDYSFSDTFQENPIGYTIDLVGDAHGFAEVLLGKFFNSFEDALNFIENSLDNPFIVKNTFLNLIPEPWVTDRMSGWNDAEDSTTPLVLDLDGDGVELLTMAAGVYWDIDNDGLGEQSAWVGADDGLLAVDRNANGVIDNQSELFGSKNIDGFTLLAREFDSNRDGKIDISDDHFGDLLVWQDANSNGYTEDGELHTLSDLNIASINVEADYTNYVMNGSRIWYESSYTLTDTTTRDIVDAVFDYNNMNSEYTGDVTLDIRTAFLPTLRGYGDLPDLHIAMSQNETLLDMVTAIAVQDVTDLLRSETLMDDLAEIMFRWAGMGAYGSVDGQGDMDDARKVVFLEKLFGDDYQQFNDFYHYPRAEAALMVEDVFTGVMNNLAAHMLVQLNGFDLFGSTIAYNPLTGEIENTGALSTSYVTALEQAVDVSDDAAQVWTNYLRIVDGIIGWDNIGSSNKAAINTAISNNGVTDTAGDLWDALTSEWDGIYGTSGDDTLYGDANDNFIIGYEGADTLYGGDGNDFLAGKDGNDTLYGQAGSNFLYGEGGNDTYVYGGGYDFIQELGGNDVILLPVGVTANDLTFVKYSETDMRILIAGYHHITIVDQFNGGGQYSVENIQLADSTLISLLDGDFYSYGTEKDDALTVVNAFYNVDSDTMYGYGGNDIITGADIAYGGDGHDNIYGAQNSTLYGEAGNDYLEASNSVLYGGDGNDILKGNDNMAYGGDGNDTYELGGTASGSYITDTGGNDEIYLNAVYTLSVINGTDLKLSYSGFGSTSNIYVENQFDIYDSNKIESIRYENGTVIDLVNYSNASLVYQADNTNNVIDLGNLAYGHAVTTVYALDGDDTVTATDNGINIYGGNGADTLYGGSGADYLDGGSGLDIINGHDGDDVIYGDDSKDIMNGGAGNDYLIGGSGSDYYEVSLGHDIADDAAAEYAKSTSGGGNDRLVLPDGVSFSDVQFTHLGNDLYIYVSENQTMTIINQSITSNRIEYFIDGVTEESYYAGHSSSSSGIDTVNGYYLYDFSIQGTSGADNLSGFDNAAIGDDVIRGKDGNDTIQGKGGNDVIYGDNDNDNLSGDNGDDTLYGGFGNDVLAGGDGDDLLYGDSGDDILNGGDGKDHYYGGSGLDTFVFEAASAYNDIDEIHGFGSSEKLDLSDLLTGFDPYTDDITDFLSLEDVGSNAYLRVDADGLGTSYAAIRIVLIDNFAGENITDLYNNGNFII